MANFNGPKTRNHPAASCYSMDWEERRMAADPSEESSDIDDWIVEVRVWWRHAPQHYWGQLLFATRAIESAGCGVYLCL
jgi:hypothetical protein